VRRPLASFVNIATAVSSILCVAAAALWVRSHVTSDTLSKLSPNGFEVISDRGGVIVWSYDGFPNAQPMRWVRGGSSRRYLDVEGYSFTGEGGGRIRWGAAGHTDYRPSGVGRGQPVRVSWTWRAMPYGPIVVILGALPAIRLATWPRRRRQRLRAAAGACVTCGYDLRATPERCPECGTVPRRDAVA
jgi:hypothetical protein